MSQEAYFTEDAKMAYTSFPKWTMEDCMKMENILYDKGYYVIPSKNSC